MCGKCCRSSFHRRTIRKVLLAPALAGVSACWNFAMNGTFCWWLLLWIAISSFGINIVRLDGINRRDLLGEQNVPMIVKKKWAERKNLMWWWRWQRIGISAPGSWLYYPRSDMCSYISSSFGKHFPISRCFCWWRHFIEFFPRRKSRVSSQRVWAVYIVST